MREVLPFDDPNNEVEIYIRSKMKKGTMMADFAATGIVPFFLNFCSVTKPLLYCPTGKRLCKAFISTAFLCPHPGSMGKGSPCNVSYGIPDMLLNIIQKNNQQP